MKLFLAAPESFLPSALTDRQAERTRRFHIQHHLEFRGLLYRRAAATRRPTHRRATIFPAAAHATRAATQSPRRRER
jgi:hypothetical protein